MNWNYLLIHFSTQINHICPAVRQKANYIGQTLKIRRILFQFVAAGKLKFKIMNKKLVVISGNLGVGKTTLAKIIGDRLGWFIGYESVTDNPYLADFYNEMDIWAFHLQVYFLGQRAKQHNIAINDPRNAILDRSIYEDGYIFASSLYQSGKITKREYDSYITLFEYVISTLPSPHLLIYLKASLETILTRIKRRAQVFDQNLSTSYLQMINNYYNEWIGSFSLCPIIVIDSDELDYFNNETDLLAIIQKINLNLI